MKNYLSKTMLLGVIAVLCLTYLNGCAAKRVVGWEREIVKAEGDAAQIIEEANTYWSKRDERSGLEKAIELYEQAAQIDQQNLELLITLARANYFLADAYLEEERELQIVTYDKGLTYAERGMALDPEFKQLVENGEKAEDAVRVLEQQYVGAIYWASANLGKWGLKKGLVTILANKDRGKKLMERCIELDESYFYGGPHRWFGGYYAKLPSIAGRDLNKSKEHFEKAIEIAPNYFGTRVLRAEHYSLNSQDRELYQQDLEFVLNTSADVIPELVPEQNVDKEKAAKMLEEIDDRFL